MNGRLALACLVGFDSLESTTPESSENIGETAYNPTNDDVAPDVTAQTPDRIRTASGP